jgi:hypothetical protein
MCFVPPSELVGQGAGEAARGSGLSEQAFGLNTQDFHKAHSIGMARYEHNGLCNTEYFDRRCRGVRGVGISGRRF